LNKRIQEYQTATTKIESLIRDNIKGITDENLTYFKYWNLLGIGVSASCIFVGGLVWYFQVNPLIVAGRMFKNVSGLYKEYIAPYIQTLGAIFPLLKQIKENDTLKLKKLEELLRNNRSHLNDFYKGYEHLNKCLEQITIIQKLLEKTKFMEIELKTELLINEFEQEINTFATQTKNLIYYANIFIESINSNMQQNIQLIPNLVTEKPGRFIIKLLHNGTYLSYNLSGPNQTCESFLNEVAEDLNIDKSSYRLVDKNDTIITLKSVMVEILTETSPKTYTAKLVKK